MLNNEKKNFFFQKQNENLLSMLRTPVNKTVLYSPLPACLSPSNLALFGQLIAVLEGVRDGRPNGSHRILYR